MLAPRQLDASAAARMCDRDNGPVALLYGGARGGGKSHWSLAQIALDDCQRYPELKVLWLRKVGKSAQESFEDMRMRVIGRVPHSYKPHQGLVTFENGSRIILGNFFSEGDVDKYLGLEYDIIAVEEATTLSVSKIQSIETTNRTSKPDWRPRVYYTTNPGNISHNYFKMRFVEPFRVGNQTTTRFIPATVDDNPWVNKEYRATLDALTGWKKDAWRYGSWDIAAGQFFTEFSIARHVIPSFKIPHHWRAWLSFDYGFTHYTAVYLLVERPDGVVFVVGEYGEQKTLPQTHAAAIKELVRSTVGRFDRISAIVAGNDCWAPDAQGRTIAAQYSELDLLFQRAVNNRVAGASAIAARFGSAEAGIAPTVFITQACPRLIASIPSLQHNPNKPEDVLKVDVEESGDGGDDWYDSFRYGIMAATREQAGGGSYENN